MVSRKPSTEKRPSPPKGRVVTRSLIAAKNLALIFAGSVIFAVGLHGLLIPHEFLSGGVVGAALILQYLMPGLAMGPVYFLLNIPLLLIGWFSVSRRFMVYSIAGMGLFSLACTLVVPAPFHVQDPILVALMSGVICGVGGGLILRSLGSAGGLDILAVYLNRRFGLRPGSVYTATNTLVLGTGAYLLDLEKALYSIVFVYISGRIVDAILAGFNRRKLVYVISEKSQEIADQVMKRVNRGVTMLQGRGGYAGKEKEVILTITTMTELALLKELIFNIDPEAFVVVNDTLEVLGNRHGRLKVY